MNNAVKSHKMHKKCYGSLFSKSSRVPRKSKIHYLWYKRFWNALINLVSICRDQKILTYWTSVGYTEFSVSWGVSLLHFFVADDAMEFQMDGRTLFLSFRSSGFKWVPEIGIRVLRYFCKWKSSYRNMRTLLCSIWWTL